MKTGRSLTELCAELDYQNEMKEDFVVDTSALKLEDDGLTLRIQSDRETELLPLAQRQVGERLGIPYKYFNRMASEAPELLATNVNHWFERNPERRMLRMMAGETRAFLSDRYLRRDNYDLMQFILPTLKEIGGLQVASCEVTDHKLYLKMTTPRIQEEIREGDIVQAGLVVSNSEVGLGAFKVQPLVLRLVCMNGMIANDHSINKYHIGRRITVEEEVQQLYTDETLRADDEAFWLKCRDIVKASMNDETFSIIVQQLARASEIPVEIPASEAVQRLSKKYTFNQNEQDNVLASLLVENDLTMYGLSNAVTRASKEIPSYDRATELEAVGGQIITLKDSEWKELAVA